MSGCFTQVLLYDHIFQIEQQKHDLEKVDHMMGKKRTELQFLQESVERKQGEINQLIRDTEAELASNKRDIKVSTIMYMYFVYTLGYLNHFNGNLEQGTMSMPFWQATSVQNLRT